MNKTILIALLAAAFASGHDEPKGKPVNLTGVVVDTGCYMSHDAKGEKHIPCATTCAKTGVPLAILDEAAGQLYLPIAMDHKNQNARLMPFIEKKVKVSGVLMEKNGMKGLVVKTIEEAH